MKEAVNHFSFSEEVWHAITHIQVKQLLQKFNNNAIYLSFFCYFVIHSVG